MIRKNLIVVFITLLTAFTLLSVGFARWQKTLVIKGYITVDKPESEYPIVPEENTVETVTDSVYQEVMPNIMEPGPEESIITDTEPPSDINTDGTEPLDEAFNAS